MEQNNQQILRDGKKYIEINDTISKIGLLTFTRAEIQASLKQYTRVGIDANDIYSCN